MSTLPKIEPSIYDPFLAVGFRRRRVAVPPPQEDPTLKLTIHTLVYNGQGASNSDDEGGDQSLTENRTDASTAFTEVPINIVLLHGHPQSSVIWHRVAPLLVKDFEKRSRVVRIIIPDLRGHGLSDAPSVERNSDGSYKDSAMKARYSKRQMARDVVEVVKAVTGDSSAFLLVGHDRGARVAHRLALDYPSSVTKMILLDIAPTVDMYQNTDFHFATAYWHWFFLTQPFPFPESMILANPGDYIAKMTSRFLRPDSAAQTAEALHPPAILNSYKAALSVPSHVQATCEDYRQSSLTGIDAEHDLASRKAGDKVIAPVRVLWGDRGVCQLLYGPEKQIAMWKNVCQNVDEKSRAVQSGHYIPEEVPDQVAEDMKDFFAF